jgi:hypothetical protein
MTATQRAAVAQGFRDAILKGTVPAPAMAPGLAFHAEWDAQRRRHAFWASVGGEQFGRSASPERATAAVLRYLARTTTTTSEG